MGQWPRGLPNRCVFGNCGSVFLMHTSALPAGSPAQVCRRVAQLAHVQLLALREPGVGYGWLLPGHLPTYVYSGCSQQPCLWVYLGFCLAARHGLCQTATNAWQTYMAGALSGGLQPAPAALAPSWVITHWVTACAVGQSHGSPSTPLDPSCHHPPFVLSLCMQSVPALIAAARGTAALVGLGVGWPHPHQPLYGAYYHSPWVLAQSRA
jgi:hypothetical protein